MMEFELIKEFNRGDMKIALNKVTFPVYPSIKCGVVNCDCHDIYDIQFEKPENYSNAGGWFCKEHLKNIFNVDVEE